MLMKGLFVSVYRCCNMILIYKNGIVACLDCMVK